MQPIEHTPPRSQSVPSNSSQSIKALESPSQSESASSTQTQESTTHTEEEGETKATSLSMGAKIVIGLGIFGILAITAVELMENTQQSSRRRRY